MPQWCAGTCIVVMVRVLLYRLVLWCGVLGFVCLLPRAMYANFLGCGAFIYGVVLVTVMTITWSGACVHLNPFFSKRRVLWAFYLRSRLFFVLVGQGLCVAIGM